MKAILVVDLDGDISHYHADIYKEDEKGNGEIVKSYCPLKPMPQTRDVGYPIDDYAVGFSDGWDALRKEILE